MVRLFQDLRVVHVQCVIDTDHLAVVELESVLEHTGEQV